MDLRRAGEGLGKIVLRDGHGHWEKTDSAIGWDLLVR